jgi:hypothetical protein
LFTLLAAAVVLTFMLELVAQVSVVMVLLVAQVEVHLLSRQVLVLLIRAAAVVALVDTKQFFQVVLVVQE